MTICARIFASLMVLVLCGSCHKTLGPCTGNCQMLQLTGIALDPGSQKPLANLKVEVNFPVKQTCFLYCVPTAIVSGTTKADGTFDLTKTVDTTIVDTRYGSITVYGPTNYIAYAEPLGPGIDPDPFVHTQVMSVSVDSTGMAPYEEFDFFQPVLLTVRLHRTAVILPHEPTMFLTFNLSGNSLSVWGLNEMPSNADTAMTLYTGANVFTKIECDANLTDSTVQHGIDSIRCVTGGNNSIDISYP
jgi:hypothetical protein